MKLLISALIFGLLGTINPLRAVDTGKTVTIQPPAASQPATPNPAAVNPDITAAIASLEQATDPSSAVAAYANGYAADRNNQALHAAYVKRMVEFGLPEMAYQQAQVVTNLNKENGIAWGVLAYVDAKRGNMMQALPEIVSAVRLAPQDLFIKRTAGELLAWYDKNSSQIISAGTLKNDLTEVKKKLGADPAFKDVYEQATAALAREATAPGATPPETTTPPALTPQGKVQEQQAPYYTPGYTTTPGYSTTVPEYAAAPEYNYYNYYNYYPDYDYPYVPATYAWPYSYPYYSYSPYYYWGPSWYWWPSSFIVLNFGHQHKFHHFRDDFVFGRRDFCDPLIFNRFNRGGFHHDRFGFHGNRFKDNLIVSSGGRHRGDFAGVRGLDTRSDFRVDTRSDFRVDTRSDFRTGNRLGGASRFDNPPVGRFLNDRQSWPLDNSRSITRSNRDGSITRSSPADSRALSRSNPGRVTRESSARERSTTTIRPQTSEPRSLVPNSTSGTFRVRPNREPGFTTRTPSPAPRVSRPEAFRDRNGTVGRNQTPISPRSAPNSSISRGSTFSSRPPAVSRFQGAPRSEGRISSPSGRSGMPARGLSAPPSGFSSRGGGAMIGGNRGGGSGRGPSGGGMAAGGRGGGGGGGGMAGGRGGGGGGGGGGRR